MTSLDNYSIFPLFHFHHQIFPSFIQIHPPNPIQSNLCRLQKKKMRYSFFYFQFSFNRRRLFRCHFLAAIPILIGIFLFIFCFHRYFQQIPTSSINSLAQCPEQTLPILYQLHSLASSPSPRPTPLNWLDLHLSPVPLANRLCLHPNFKNSSPFSRILAIVHSHFDHFPHRQSLRRQFHLHHISAIFVLSSANASKELLTKMEEEAKTEGDLLVLSNLQEQYRLLAHKTRAWVQWLATNWASKCAKFLPPPKFLLKMDDDLMVNWPALGRLLDRVGPRPKRIVLCRTFTNGQISRNPKSKWFLSTKEFPTGGGGLGLYCQGLGLLLSWDLLAIAAENLRRVQFLWMDDWYLSHGLLAGSNATFVDISPHIRNVEMSSSAIIGGPASNVHYSPIFAHFRPAKQFPMWRKSLEWTKMLEEEKGKQRNGHHCSAL